MCLTQDEYKSDGWRDFSLLSSFGEEREIKSVQLQFLDEQRFKVISVNLVWLGCFFVCLFFDQMTQKRQQAAKLNFFQVLYVC